MSTQNSASSPSPDQSNNQSKGGWIPGSIWAVSVAIGLMAISVSMTFSVSPFFMTSVLGLSMFSLGAIEGFSEGLSQISKLFSGITGDMFRRKKPTLLTGFVLAIVSKPLFILANGSGLVIASKIIERISNGVMSTPRDAFVAEASPADRKGSSFGLMMSFKTGGCVVGSFLIGGLLLYTDDYLLLLWLGFGAALISAIVLAVFMKEKKPAENQTVTKSKTESVKIKSSDIKSLNWAYWSLLGVASIYMCARFSDGFLILRMKELGASTSLSASVIGIFNMVSVLCCFPIGRLSDKFDREKVLYFSIISLILCNICFIFANSVAVGMVGVIFWGAQRATSQILFCAIIADVAPKKIMGTAMGLFFVASGLIAWLAGILSGTAADKSLQHTFMLGLTMSSLALIAHMVRHYYIAKNPPALEEESVEAEMELPKAA